MNTSTTSLLQMGSIEALVVRKQIKNLHLAILPPDGKVRVAAPMRMSDDAIRTLLAGRIAWIRKHQEKFAGQARQTPRKYVSGESHYLFGKRYRLEVITAKAAPRAFLKGKNVIVLQVRPRTDLKKREAVMMEWYRHQLRDVLEELVPRWERKLKVKTSAWGIKRMKTRWGTCNQKAGRTWFNLELAKKPQRCIEYVVAHELTHLIEKKHNDRFTGILTKHLPRWKSLKTELNRFILSHEEWGH